ncbi:hypothetical protein [Thermogutta sp.]|uniref:hypothetical protein n=1 Tax=Thermogutta sp. TaxID=1962930 RepID=UPI0032202CDF
MPNTAERAVEIAEAGGVAWAEKIVVRTVAGEKYSRIVDYTLGPKPEPLPIEDTEADLADIPF